MHDGYVYAPDITYSQATFERGSVSYKNDFPSCATYSVRIDLNMSKVFAVRQKKSDAKNPDCAHLENRIEMQLADGYDVVANPLEGHFVPIFQLLAAIF